MDIKAGQVWLLKSAEICRSVHSAFVDEMADLCGKEQTIELIGDEGRFYTIGCEYFWDSRCLDQLVRDVREEEALVFCNPTATPEPCPERVAVPENTAFIVQAVVKVGEEWLLKRWEDLHEAVRFQMTDDMMPYLGHVHRIVARYHSYFEIEDGQPTDDRYRFPYQCLDRLMPWATAPENSTTDTGLDAQDIKHHVSPDLCRIRKVESSYDVLYETDDGAGCVTVKLFINHSKHTYRVASLAKDGKFLFDTAQQGDPKIWRTVLKAIENAMEFAEREVGNG